MPKRTSELQLTKDFVDGNDGDEGFPSSGTFQRASDEQLRQRRLVKRARRPDGGDGTSLPLPTPPPAAASGNPFSGVQLAPPKSTFTFGATAPPPPSDERGSAKRTRTAATTASPAAAAAAAAAPSVWFGNSAPAVAAAPAAEPSKKKARTGLEFGAALSSSTTAAASAYGVASTTASNGNTSKWKKRRAEEGEWMYDYVADSDHISNRQIAYLPEVVLAYLRRSETYRAKAVVDSGVPRAKKEMAAPYLPWNGGAPGAGGDTESAAAAAPIAAPVALDGSGNGAPAAKIQSFVSTPPSVPTPAPAAPSAGESNGGEGGGPDPDWDTVVEFEPVVVFYQKLGNDMTKMSKGNLKLQRNGAGKSRMLMRSEIGKPLLNMYLCDKPGDYTYHPEPTKPGKPGAGRVVFLGTSDIQGQATFLIRSKEDTARALYQKLREMSDK